MSYPHQQIATKDYGRGINIYIFLKYLKNLNSYIKVSIKYLIKKYFLRKGNT